MKKIKFQLISNQVKQNAIDCIRDLPVDVHKPLILEVKPRTRSLDQNAKLHAMFSDFARSGLFFAGKSRSLDEWKVILISGHSIATGGQGEVIAGIEGELICIRESSAGMTVGRMASLIEYVTAYATEKGVQLSDFVYDQYYGVEK